MPAVWISQKDVSSTTTRTKSRTRFLRSERAKLLKIIEHYFRDDEYGEEVTLACLDGLGNQAMYVLGEPSGTLWDVVKQDVGLYVAILLVERFGDDGVETLRNDGTKRNSTRSPGRVWPTLSWVSRYTPHRLTGRGRARLHGEPLPEAGEGESR